MLSVVFKDNVLYRLDKGEDAASEEEEEAADEGVSRTTKQPRVPSYQVAAGFMCGGQITRGEDKDMKEVGEADMMIKW